MDVSAENQHEVNQIVAQIRERGYCVVPSVISVEKADEARGALERLLANEMTDEIRAAKTQRVGGIAFKHRIFAELLENPLTREYLANIPGRRRYRLLDLVGQYLLSRIR